MIFVKDSLSDVNETQLNESEMHEDLELSKFLNQFQDVFIDDIPGELPPKQGDDDHAIELIPDANHSLYVQKTDAMIVIITIYVDDLIIGGDALKYVEHVKALFCKQFDMKDLGELRYFLGIEMIWNEGSIWLLQKKYGLDMLMKYGMADCKPISTPLDQNFKL
ncbi:hypothetical protein L7F22_054956 [Adiantum nelumboides]|nr:hypothetical protein [Adiantum nelumboides]